MSPARSSRAASVQSPTQAPGPPLPELHWAEGSSVQDDGSFVALDHCWKQFCGHMKSLGAQPCMHASMSKPAHLSNAALSGQR